MPGIIKDYLHGYRANPKNLYGAKDRMETLPTEFDKYTLGNYVKGMQEGKPYGVPQLTREQLANIALHEGRDDFGLNLANSENKNAMKIAKALRDKGVSEDGALFAAAVYDKHQVANRLKIPFEHAWNGVGVTSEGRSGADYAKEAKQMNYAASHPKNAEVIDYIDRVMGNKLTPQEITLNQVRAYEEGDGVRGSMLGGTLKNIGYRSHMMENIKDPNALKMLRDSDPDILQTIVNNKIREAHGINPAPIVKTIDGKTIPGEYDMATNTSIAVEHPEISAYIDKTVQDAIKTIGAKTPVFKAGGKVKLPDGYKHGGSSSLI